MEIRSKKTLGFTLLLAGLVLCGIGLWLLLSPAQYQATVRIKLDLDMPDANGQISYNPYFIQTEFEILKSQAILGKVINSLNLNIEWGKKYGDGGPLEIQKTVELLRRRMNVDLVSKTELIEISFRREDPKEAASVANAIAEAYYVYRLEVRKQLRLKGIQTLTDYYQKEEQTIKAKKENLEQLRERLNIPNPEPADGFLKTNYPSYFQAKQELQKTTKLQTLLFTKIETEKLDRSIPKSQDIEIVKLAQPPELPVGPNRLLGVALFVVGVFSITSGLLMFKFSRHLSA
jgi:uncharacterized protein involved in exopolysaccharide biosynthesis